MIFVLNTSNDLYANVKNYIFLYIVSDNQWIDALK